MTGSKSTKALDAAVFKAKFEIIPPAKDGVNPFHKSKYQTLNAIEGAVRGPEFENGLLRTFHIDSHGRADGVDTILTMMISHPESGEWKSWGMPLPRTMILGRKGEEREFSTQPQQMGIAITYNKRYMTKSFYCIPDDDDDGEGAYQRGEGAGQRKPEPKPTVNAAGAKPAESQSAPSFTIQMVLMELRKCQDEGEVKALVHKYTKFISLQHPDEKAKFRKEYDLKMAALQEGE